MSWKSQRITNPKVVGRGGSSLIEVNGKIVGFGGADRDQTSLNDLVVLSNEKMTVQECSGDVPTPRSGHAVAAYGKYMFLFGGIDFAEDADFNDLYVLDTDTYCWKYAGEAGVEVAGRNSHSMGVLQQGSQAVLVIYGGASCTLGPLNDTVYAVLPSVEEIAKEDFFVTWQKLEALPDENPGCREMQGCCTTGSYLFISGGRNDRGELLQDIWKLSLEASSTSSENENGSPILIWKRAGSLFQFPCCSYGMVFLPHNRDSSREESSVEQKAPTLVHEWLIFGGFMGFISGDLYSMPLDANYEAISEVESVFMNSSPSWQKVTMSIPSPPARFGHAMCAYPSHSESSFVIFGGVAADEDYGDMWICSRIE